MDRKAALLRAQSIYQEILVNSGLLLQYAGLIMAQGLVSAIESASEQLEAIQAELALLEKEKTPHREHS